MTRALIIMLLLLLLLLLLLAGCGGGGSTDTAELAGQSRLDGICSEQLLNPDISYALEDEGIGTAEAMRACMRHGGKNWVQDVQTASRDEATWIGCQESMRDPFISTTLAKWGVSTRRAMRVCFRDGGSGWIWDVRPK